MSAALDQAAPAVAATSAAIEARLVPFRPQVQRHILAMIRDRAETLATACSFEIDERGVLLCDPQPESRTEEAT